MTENYQAFEGINLSDARMKNETREQYKSRLKINRKIVFTEGICINSFPENSLGAK